MNQIIIAPSGVIQYIERSIVRGREEKTKQYCPDAIESSSCVVNKVYLLGYTVDYSILSHSPPCEMSPIRSSS